MVEIISDTEEKLVLSANDTEMTLSPNPKTIKNKAYTNYKSVITYYGNKENAVEENLNKYSKIGIRNHISILLSLPILHYWKIIEEILSYKTDSHD